MTALSGCREEEKPCPYGLDKQCVQHLDPDLSGMRRPGSYSAACYRRWRWRLALPSVFLSPLANEIEMEQDLRKRVRPIVCGAERELCQVSQEWVNKFAFPRQPDTTSLNHGRNHFHSLKFRISPMAANRDKVCQSILPQQGSKPNATINRLDDQGIRLPLSV